MAKKGSITVFLALILSLLLSLVGASIQSVQAAAARTQILNSLDIGLYSLFGQYDTDLLNKYDLFFLDGSNGSGELDLGSVYDNMESYMKPALKQNSQKLKIKQGGFSGYRIATDQNGEVFYHQVVTMMKQTLGSQGVSKVLEKLTGKVNKVKQDENSGKHAEDKNTLENYDSEMAGAASKSEAAKAEQERQKEENPGMGDLSSGEEGLSDGEEKPAVVNPIPILKRIRQMSLLDLIVPQKKGISDGEISKSSLLSERKMEEGMTMPGGPKADGSVTSKALFQQYLADRMGNYMNSGDGNLRYQMEYILAGKDSDRKNLEAVAGRLLLIREGVNGACLMGDSVRRGQVQALALAIASGFLVPPASALIEAAILLCWSFAESVLDLREMFHGGKVPLVKTPSQWQLSLENLPYLLEGLDSQRRDCEDGMSYEDYIQVLMLTQSKAQKLYRGMDMVEDDLRQLPGRKDFRLDCCLEAVEASVDVKANRTGVYTVTKQYGYT